MEVLSRLLRNLPVAPGFSYHLKCVKIHLTHLVFAADLLVFTRGDVPSVQAVKACLDLFASYSGLRANPMKTSLYFGGVPPSLKALILSATGFVEGSFPVKYLGIPLFHARLTEPMFAPLLDKIKSLIGHWATNFPSYAGRTQHINSVIFRLKSFWGFSVLLPKGIIRKINKLCKDFLWGIEPGHNMHVFKGWDSFCLPRTEGGVDIKEVKWVHAYILKDIDIWGFHLNAAYSLFWSSIIKCRDLLIQLLGSPTQAHQFLQTPDYKDKFYEMIRIKGAPFSQSRIIWDSFCYLKHNIIGTLATQGRLPTVDKLCSRGLFMVNRCVLCESSLETHSHIFFECPYSATVWRDVVLWLRATPCVHLPRISTGLKTITMDKGCRRSNADAP
ncbi:uncharacterized protein LOC141649590 [Silene latifolia]|uniref:uncharacterized protein LOC141649590 n=1 Tax=Silene latifolia TaxID=37657 RepID=UPI003D7723AF